MKRFQKGRKNIDDYISDFSRRKHKKYLNENAGIDQKNWQPDSVEIYQFMPFLHFSLNGKVSCVLCRVLKKPYWPLPQLLLAWKLSKEETFRTIKTGKGFCFNFR
jgi:hypothetical protein